MRSEEQKKREKEHITITDEFHIVHGIPQMEQLAIYIFDKAGAQFSFYFFEKLQQIDMNIGHKFSRSI